MRVGASETADDVGARTQAPIEACADTDDSRESDRIDHTQCSRMHRQQVLTGSEGKYKKPMSNNETNTDSSYGPDEQDQEQIEALHDRIDAVRDDGLAYREHVVDPLKSKLDEALDRLDDLEAENQEFHERVEQLDQQVENLIGVDDSDLSTHDKRVRDVRAAMIRRAEAKANKRSDNIEGKTALSYSEIQDLLADHGHGKIHKPQAYRIMDDIKNVDGFSKGTKQSTHGNDVKAVRLNLAALPAYARGNNVTTSGTKAGGEMTEKHGENHNHG